MRSKQRGFHHFMSEKELLAIIALAMVAGWFSIEGLLWLVSHIKLVAS